MDFRTANDKIPIGVITNARPDHLEEMGPTLNDVRKSLGNSVPYNGKVVLGENAMVNTIAPVAEYRKLSCALLMNRELVKKI
ncbi:MAG: hypothetical protein CM1200mP10_29870 [Candidatus Neomarinimicrobiota bacterium]|nr:MAG: hypothetical protein CM1200mP10_29870 [Candidatus Neomarinimicrobiota bacterium]